MRRCVCGGGGGRGVRKEKWGGRQGDSAVSLTLARE